MPPPPLKRILEYGLYVDDVDRAADFYTRVFGFPALFRDDRLAALDVEGAQVLLLFLEGASGEPMELSGGTLPPHDGSGQMHFAFAVAADQLERWDAWLEEQGVAIESRMTWPRGGESLYFRDPDGHLVELLTPGVWETY